MKFFLYVLIFISAVTFPACAETQGKDQPIHLLDGRTIYGFMDIDVPEKLARDICTDYAFKDLSFTPLPDGKYTADDNISFIVERNCIYTTPGKSKLKDGRVIEFYKENMINLDGNIPFFCEKDRCTRVPDGDYTLENDAPFEIIGGHAAIEGSPATYDGHMLVAEDRD